MHQPSWRWIRIHAGFGCLKEYSGNPEMREPSFSVLAVSTTEAAASPTGHRQRVWAMIRRRARHVVRALTRFRAAAGPGRSERKNPSHTNASAHVGHSRNSCDRCCSGMARDGIEPPTRGFFRTCTIRSRRDTDDLKCTESHPTGHRTPGTLPETPRLNPMPPAISPARSARSAARVRAARCAVRRYRHQR
jgi:hypothetical protein